MYDKLSSPGRKIFQVCNTIFLLSLGIACLLPLINILAISFSSKSAAATGNVGFWPIEFTTSAYSYVLERTAFWTALGITVKRVLLGGGLNLLLTVLTAYPLSKTKEKFQFRTFFAWFFFFSTLFNGGLIPGYMLIKELNLLDSIWALVLPGAVPVFNVILMLNFFRQLPQELEDAAFVDGAGPFRALFMIFIPCARASIATVVLFSIVTHWNAYFDGIIFSNFPENYPLQSYLRNIIASANLSSMAAGDWKMLGDISDRTVKAAQIFISMIPVLCVYPYLQRYFVKGMTIGSVKG